MALPRYAPPKPEQAIRLDLERAIEALQHQLEAQKKLTIALEYRANRSLTVMQAELNKIALATTDWHLQLRLIEAELQQLADLLADTTLLQKMAAGKVNVCLVAIDLQLFLTDVSRHLQCPTEADRARLICNISSDLPPVWADTDLTEAVITDLLARAVKYSDSNSPVVLEAVSQTTQVHLRVFAQRFAPTSEADFVPEIALCCKRIELQQGEITCQMHEGLMLVTVMLPIAA
jgi:signal transduction histidine kinase